MMGEREFRAMKKSAIFINNGRGPTVDEAGAERGAAPGLIAGAALDVFEVEPVDPNNALLHMDNVLVSPHIASATARMAPETRRRLGREIATVLQGKWPRSAVNPGVLPQDLPDPLAALSDGPRPQPLTGLGVRSYIPTFSPARATRPAEMSECKT